MTAQMLQEALVRDIEKIFQGDRFSNSLGKRVPLNVFEQNLPITQSEDDPDPVPYIIVRLETGTTKSGTDPQEVLVTLLVGIIDEDTQNIGHKTVLGILQKIHERFEKEPMLDNKYRFQDPFDWALQDEESFPYFFGAASMTFQTSAIRKEDRFA